MTVDPSSLSLVLYPDPILRTRTKPVDTVNDEVREVAKRMIEIMFEAEGIGLAAPQVGVPWRMFVAHVPHSEHPDEEGLMTTTAEPMVCINPRFEEPSRDIVKRDEGCLSLPDITGAVIRPTEITMHATGLDGQESTVRGAGLLARCWQHEFDHLEGVLILDRMDQMSRLKARSAIREMERRGT